MPNRFLVLLLVLTVSPAAPDSRQRQRQGGTTSAEMRLKKAVEGTDDLRYSGDNTTPLSLGCASCNDRELRKKYTINNIQKEILSKLNMKTPPNVTGKNLTFKAGMYDLISKKSPTSYSSRPLHHPVDMQNDDPSTYSSAFYAEEEEEAQFLPKTILISPSKEHTKLRHHTRGGPILMYECHSKTLEENRVTGALLHMYLRGSGLGHALNTTITVRKVTRSGSGGEKLHLVISHAAVRPNGTEGEWVSLDVTNLVTDWYKKPKDNLGIVIDATPNTDHQSPIILPTHNSEKLDDWVPFLEIKLQSDRKSRMRRTINYDCDENSKEPRCCRRPLIVNFDDFGWDWVVAPRQYNAYYCSGECPYAFQTSSLNAHIVSQSQTTKVPLCCAPKKMSSVTMIYYDHDLELRYSTLPNTQVDSCACA